MDLINSPLGATILLTLTLAGMATLTRAAQKWSRENRAQAAAMAAEKRYWEWYSANYRDVAIPAFLRQPHPAHRVDERV